MAVTVRVRSRATLSHPGPFSCGKTALVVQRRRLVSMNVLPWTRRGKTSGRELQPVEAAGNDPLGVCVYGIITGNSLSLENPLSPWRALGIGLLGVAVRHVTHPWMLPMLNHSLASALCALCMGSFCVLG